VAGEAVVNGGDLSVCDPLTILAPGYALTVIISNRTDDA
jgi:hypothetical protein